MPSNYKTVINFRDGIQVDTDDLISNNGLVGIGSTIPRQQLDVRGNVIVDGRVSPGATAPDDHLKTQLSVKAGSHAVGVIFPREPWAIEQMLRPVFTSRQLNEPSVGTIAIQGPLKVTGLGDTVSRQKIFTCRPNEVQDEEPCAEKILSMLARRAYRRPITEEDLVSIMIPYHMAYKEGGFEAGIKFALQRISKAMEGAAEFLGMAIFQTQSIPAMQTGIKIGMYFVFTRAGDD